MESDRSGLATRKTLPSISSLEHMSGCVEASHANGSWSCHAMCNSYPKVLSRVVDTFR